MDDVIIPKAADAHARWIGALAAMAGMAAALFYHEAGLTLSHYDAKAHLVVARRIIDSMTPGWEQIGAVWLPLPHLLNALPVQIDVLYRTGGSAIAMSIASFVLSAYLIAWLILRSTRSVAGALAGVAVFALNPNVLYLQSTPMTELLLIALMLGSTALLYRWVESDGRTPGNLAGGALAAACLTRYEAWPVSVAALTLTALALWRRGERFGVAVRRAGSIAIYPVAAIGGFFVLSKATVGSWLVTDGFYVADNVARGHPVLTLVQVMYGIRRLSGYGLVIVACVSALVIVLRVIARPRQAALLVMLCIPAAALLPSYAFYNGHPFRMRYMIPLLAGASVLAGAGVGLLNRHRTAATLALVLVTVGIEARPLTSTAPMIAEAQWDVPNSRARVHVTRCLAARQPGEKIMVSMASLAHYMQELSGAGIRLQDFLHEGNGEIWKDALSSPRRHVPWLLIEERAEGGDMLFKIAGDRPAFLDGFDRVCEGGGVALYRRR